MMHSAVKKKFGFFVVGNESNLPPKRRLLNYDLSYEAAVNFEN